MNSHEELVAIIKEDMDLFDEVVQEDLMPLWEPIKEARKKMLQQGVKQLEDMERQGEAM